MNQPKDKPNTKTSQKSPQKYDLGPEYTFQPKISKTAQSLSKEKVEELRQRVAAHSKLRQKKVRDDASTNLTFKPHVNKSPVKHQALKPRYELLFEVSKMREEEKKRTEMMKNVEGNRKPMINQYNFSEDYVPLHERVKQKFIEDKAIHVELEKKLAAGKNKRLNHLAEIDQECTFQPVLYTKPRSQSTQKKITKKQAQERSQSACLTMYDRAGVIQKRLNSQREEMILAEKNSCRSTVPRSKSYIKPRLYDPRKPIEQPKPETFRPELVTGEKTRAMSAKRRQVTMGKSGKVNVYSFLYKSAKDQDEYMNMKRLDIVEEDRRNAKPEKFTEPQELVNYDKDFLVRIEQYQDVHDEKVNKISEEKDKVDFQAGFKPKVNENNEPPSSVPRYEKLYHTASEINIRRASKVAEKELNETTSCSFEPEINPHIFDPDSSVYERLSQPQDKSKILLSKEERDYLGCTFKPKKIAKYKGQVFSSHYGQPDPVITPPDPNQNDSLNRSMDQMLDSDNEESLKLKESSNSMVTESYTEPLPEDGYGDDDQSEDLQHTGDIQSIPALVQVSQPDDLPISYYSDESEKEADNDEAHNREIVIADSSESDKIPEEALRAAGYSNDSESSGSDNFVALPLPFEIQEPTQFLPSSESLPVTLSALDVSRSGTQIILHPTPSQNSDFTEDVLNSPKPIDLSNTDDEKPQAVNDSGEGVLNSPKPNDASYSEDEKPQAVNDSGEGVLNSPKPIDASYSEDEKPQAVNDSGEEGVLIEENTSGSYPAPVDKEDDYADIEV